MYIPKLRRLNDVLAEVRKVDPETELHLNLLYHMVKSGDITKFKYGNAWAINLDELYGFFTKKGGKK